MKSLIMKDLYNISHNTKSMLFILVVLAVMFTFLYDVQGYIFLSAFLCNMMIVTTFSFDENSNWARYAMITPVTRKDLVAGKFIVLFIFSAIGAAFGFIVSAVGGIVTGKVAPTPAGIGNLLFLALIALVLSMILGGMSIPLVIRYGAEKGRVLILVSYIVPAAICFAVLKLLELAGVAITDRLVFLLLCCSPVIALLWCHGMYRISYSLFCKQEL